MNNFAFNNALEQGRQLNNEAYQAYEKGQYKKAVRLYKECIVIIAKGMGKNCAELTKPLIGISESYMKLNDSKNALVTANRLCAIAMRRRMIDKIKIAHQLIEELCRVSSNGLFPFICIFFLPYFGRK